MANLTNIIKISETDYETLADGGSVVKDGQTYTFDANALYLVPDTSTSVTGEIPNDLGLTSTLLYLENDSGQIGTGINLSTLKTNLGLTNAVTSTSTLTSGRIILGNGSRTIRATSYTIDTTQLSGSTYIPTSYVVQNSINTAIKDLKTDLDLNNNVTSTSTLTSGHVILGGGNRTISSSSYTIDTSKLSGSVYIPTSYVVQNAIDEAVNGLSLSITTTSNESLGNLKLTNGKTGVSLTDINKAVVIELDGTSATSVGDHTITITSTQYNIIKENYPNVIIQLEYTPNMSMTGRRYYVYLTPKSGDYQTSTSSNTPISTTLEYTFFGGKVKIGQASDYIDCNVSLSIEYITSARATLTMSKVQTAKYQHNLRYYYQQTVSSSTAYKYNTTYFTATIINDSPTAFTTSTLLSYLNTNGLTSLAKCLSISGIQRNGSTDSAYILSELT